MSFSIQNDYSILNNYNYTNKSTLDSILDTLSAPCRRVLGGRSVDLFSQTYDSKMMTVFKVLTVVFSILIFPIAIVSTLSLALKLVTRSQDWEKKKIAEQSTLTWAVIDIFKKSFEDKDYNLAIHTIKENPEIATRSEISDSLFTIINQKINTSASWKEIAPLLKYLSNKHATTLINHAIKTRLMEDYKNDCFHTSANDLLQFIKNSLPDQSLEAFETCYKHLLTNILKLEADPIINAIKLNFADALISSLTHMQLAKAKTDLDRNCAEVNDIVLRKNFLEIGKEQDKNKSQEEQMQDAMRAQAGRAYYSTFNNPESMANLRTSVDEMSLASQLHYDLLETNEEDILAKYPEFQNGLRNLMKSEEEKQLLQTMEFCLTKKAAYIYKLEKIASKDAFKQLLGESPSISASCEEKTKDLQNLIEKMTKPTASASYSNKPLLLPLQAKKIEYTVVFFTETNNRLNEQIKNLTNLALKQYAEAL